MEGWGGREGEWGGGEGERGRGGRGCANTGDHSFAQHTMVNDVSGCIWT